MIKLYLDIDGVLIGKNQTIPNKIEDFLKFVIQEFECYWLTTHCKGELKTVIKYLGDFYPESHEKYWRKVKPTNWDVLKTEAIDYTSDFIWLDDQPLQSELIQLSENESIDRLIIVDLKKNSEIARIRKLLEAKINNTANKSNDSIRQLKQSSEA